MKELALIVLLTSVLGLAGFLYRASLEGRYTAPFPERSPVACTQEAKICPDGTAVGRTGSNCEFTPCPVQNSATSSPSATTTATSTIVE